MRTPDEIHPTELNVTRLLRVFAAMAVLVCAALAFAPVRAHFTEWRAAQKRYNALQGDVKDRRRNATVCAVGAGTLGIAAGVLAWNAWRGHPERGTQLAFEF